MGRSEIRYANGSEILTDFELRLHDLTKIPIVKVKFYFTIDIASNNSTHTAYHIELP
jgi:hypothetical protein